MTYIGIDYGSKRVGVATSDGEAGMAFPVTVLLNDSSLLFELKKIATERNTKLIVLGESKNYQGDENAIMKAIHEFKKRLEEEGFEVWMEPEFMTSAEAVHLQGENKMIDASAATILLQSFLDKRKNNI